MTDDEAMRVLSPLVALTGGWDDPKVESWVHRLANLENWHWAMEAVDQVIDSHTHAGAPPWAKVFEAYQAIGRRNAGSHYALPSAERCITLDAYLANLKLSAAGGNRAAEVELERWERLARAPRKDSPNWVEALR